MEQADGAVKMGRPALEAEGELPIRPFQGCVEIFGSTQQFAAVSEGLAEQRVHRDRPFVGLERWEKSLLLAFEHAQIIPGLGVGRIERYGSLDERDRKRLLAFVVEHAVENIAAGVVGVVL